MFGYLLAETQEDDPYFATKGGGYWFGFSLSGIEIYDTLNIELGLRETWRVGANSFLRFNLGNIRGINQLNFANNAGDYSPIGLAYQYDWKRGQNQDAIKTGRWFIEGGLGGLSVGDARYSDIQLSHSTIRTLSRSIRTGVIMDTSTFGIVSLSFAAIHDGRNN